jgi:drug/metabolite transporter (DMT)-like permease
MSRLRSSGSLMLCALLLGLSYVLIRATLPAVGPFVVTGARTLVGGLTLVAIGARAGQRIHIREWRSYLLLGALSAAIPFTLTSMALVSIDAGSAAVLNTVGPMFAVGLDCVARRRWPGRSTVLGLVTATTGVVLTVNARGVHWGRSSLVGIGLALAGACVFAYAGFFAARRFAAAQPMAVAAGQQLAASAFLAPLAIIAWPANPRITATLVGQLLMLGVFGGAVAYLLYYRLIATQGPVFTANVSLLVPVCGVLWGWALLSERVPAISLVGMGLVVGGLALVLRPSRVEGLARHGDADIRESRRKPERNPRNDAFSADM